jgi:uncharacterized surface protein with fasciclin (FAS1) repeats
VSLLRIKPYGFGEVYGLCKESGTTANRFHVHMLRRPQHNEKSNQERKMKKIITTSICALVAIAGVSYAGSCGGSTAAVEKAPADIVDTAVGAGSFSTLVAAVTAADLVDTLKGDGPFTVFAPTDEAFAKLPAGTVEDLLKPENKAKLQAILKYHVVPGKVLAADVIKLTSATTVQGQDVGITVNDAGVSVDKAQVVKTDIETSNGVIHVIDSVMLPTEG